MSSAFPNGDRPADDRRRSPRLPDAITVPPEILARHRARVLDPATAVRGPGGERPLSTVYRTDSLLVPIGEVGSLVRDGRPAGDLNTALDALGLELRVPFEQDWHGIGRPPATLGVPVPLVRREGAVADRAPDPWAALVLLRERLGAKRTAGVGLDHLVMSASITVEGAPVSHGGAVGGVPVSHGGSVGGGLALHTGSRNPVALLMPRPARPPAALLPASRRPVVAVLDTGIGPHPWWDGQDPTDPVVEVSQEFQDLLAQHELGLPGPTEPHPLDSPYDDPDAFATLLGLIDSHSGHGTFVAGLVHQLCPAARILSLRLLHSDGFSTEGSLLLALNWLADRVDHAVSSGDTSTMVDVVSLSLGFYPETADPAQVAQVHAAISRLTAQGVLVVAAAGNDATTRPFLPAAFGRGPGAAAAGLELLSGIGARNAPGVTTAAFSNWGDWVSRWAPGNALVSTVPVWEGAGGPGLAHPDGGGGGPRLRTAPDPDDLTSGFAVWAGTSFATPVVAGLLADALARDGRASRDVGGVDRAQRALDAADAELARRRWQ